jgi:hypothetical protein
MVMLCSKGVMKLEKSLNILGLRLYVIFRRGYYKIVHDRGSFGYYSGQGFWWKWVSKKELTKLRREYGTR